MSKGLICCDFMKSCTWIVVIMLCWSYLCLYELNMMLFMLIWTYVDNIHVDLTLWWCWSCVDSELVLSDAMYVDLYMFLIVHKYFSKSMILNNVSFLSWFQWFYLHMFPYLAQVVVLTHTISLFPNDVGLGRWSTLRIIARRLWLVSQVIGGSSMFRDVTISPF